MHRQWQIEKLLRTDFSHGRQRVGSRISIRESNGGQESSISRREVGNFRKYGTIFSSTRELFQHFRNGALFAPTETTVTLKIEKLADKHGTTLNLIGRIRAEHLDELRGQIAASAPSALELQEVTMGVAEG